MPILQNRFVFLWADKKYRIDKSATDGAYMLSLNESSFHLDLVSGSADIVSEGKRRMTSQIS